MFTVVKVGRAATDNLLSHCHDFDALSTAFEANVDVTTGHLRKNTTVNFNRLMV